MNFRFSKSILFASGEFQSTKNNFSSGMLKASDPLEQNWNCIKIGDRFGTQCDACRSLTYGAEMEQEDGVDFWSHI